MKTWHIWDFPGPVYLFLKDNVREEFFSKMFEKFGGKRPYARFLGVGQTHVKQYYKGCTYKNGIKHTQSIPISLFKKSRPLIDKELKEKIENNISLLKAKNRGIPIINPKLPFRESPAFYRIVAHMIGDGSAPRRKVPYYANTSKELREQFKKDLNIFGEIRIYERVPNTTPIVCFPKVVTDILSYILNVEFSNPKHLPRQIFDASDECKASFLRALFDDEGTMSTTLAISMSNQNIIKEIKQLVEDFDIRTTNISKKSNKQWRDNFSFSVSAKFLRDFKDKIGFLHPQKFNNLNAAINTRNRKQRTRNTEWLKEETLKILKNRSLRTIEIANNIQLTLGHTLQYLKILEKENKIKRSGFKNRIYWSVLKV